MSVGGVRGLADGSGVGRDEGVATVVAVGVAVKGTVTVADTVALVARGVGEAVAVWVAATVSVGFAPAN